MKLHLLESGLDSLNKGFQNLLEYEKLYYNPNRKNKPKKRLFFLKDAILFIQHGVEILLKYILFKHSPYLVFSNIDSNVKKAFIEKKNRNLQSVFESDLKHKIHTVNYIEAIERLKMLPNLKLEKDLEEKLMELELYRNLIMHSAPYLNEVEINDTLDELANKLDLFFYRSIGNRYKTISGYGEFVKKFEEFQDRLIKNDLKLKADVNELFLNSLTASGLNIGTYEVRRFTHINSCTKFFDNIFNSNIKFGCDIYNGYCAGDIKIKRTSNDVFQLSFENDTLKVEFKLKSIILYMPVAMSRTSPIIFIECGYLNEEEQCFLENKQEDLNNIENVEYLHLEDGSQIFGEENIEKFYQNKNIPPYNNHIRFYTQGILAFLNVQGLKYNRGIKFFIRNNIGLLGKDAEIMLREVLVSLENNVN